MKKGTERVVEGVTGFIICAVLVWAFALYGLPAKVKANEDDNAETARRQAIAEKNIVELDFQQRVAIRDSKHMNLKLDEVMKELGVSPVEQPDLPDSKLTDPNIRGGGG